VRSEKIAGDSLGFGGDLGDFISEMGNVGTTGRGLATGLPIFTSKLSSCAGFSYDTDRLNAPRCSVSNRLSVG
jgi:hypothetical protein